MQDVWLRVGGYPATEIAPHSPPTWETLANGGTGEISWSFSLPAYTYHQAVAPGTLVEVMCGPLPLASGLMVDVDRGTWECVAMGLFDAAKQYPALDGSLAATRDVGAAIAHAIGEGWPVTNPAAISGVAAGDPAGNPVSVGQLLDEYAEQTGQRWGVDPNGVLYMTSGPTTPAWLASPEAAAFGMTSEGRAAKLYGRYLDSTSGNNETASAGSGVPQEAVDLTERGAMSSAEATAILQGALGLGKSETAWINGATLTRHQLQTIGGTPAFLAGVRAGESMRSFGITYANQAGALDTLIGKTRYTAGHSSIYVEPANAAARTFVDVVAAA